MSKSIFFILYSLTNIESDESREILHFHYTTWPDFGVPRSPIAFLRFLADVRESGVLDQNVGPAIVHCSAGIGRSGTFCLVDTCLILVSLVNDFLFKIWNSKPLVFFTHVRIII